MKDFIASESPFLTLNSFKQQPGVGARAKTAEPPKSTFSPFQNIYGSKGEEFISDPTQQEAILFSHELFDRELNISVEDLVQESRVLYATQLDEIHLGLDKEMMVEEMLHNHFLPLEGQISDMLSRIVSAADEFDAGILEREAFIAAVDEIPFESENLSPSFEDFLGKVFKKVKKVAKKVVSKAKRGIRKGVALAKKFGLGFVLRRLRPIAMKFLKGILNKIMNRLPTKYRPLAKKLASKISLQNEIKDDSNPIPLQNQLDSSLIQLTLAENEYEVDEAVRMSVQLESHQGVDPTLFELDRARDKFINQISELEEGEQAGPIIEEFIASVLMALKWGIRIIGRQRVKNALTSILTRLVQRFVGRKYARPLTAKIVDYGFQTLNLEVSGDGEQNEFAAEAIAATIEGALHELKDLKDYQVEDEEIFQTELVQAFEKAAAANLPDLLPEEQYESLPNLRESFLTPSMWKMKNIGKKRRKYRYKKNSKVYRMKLSPKKALAIKSFGEKNLGKIISAKYGIHQAKEIPVQIHLFELMHGGTIQDIATHEFNLPEQQRLTEDLLGRFHPLTKRAAAILLGEPDLGCNKCGSCGHQINKSAHHRVFYLEVPGASLQKFQDHKHSMRSRKVSDTSLTFDTITQQMTVNLFFSEYDAQNLARFIQKNSLGEAFASIISRLKDDLRILLKGRSPDQLIIFGLTPEKHYQQLHGISDITRDQVLANWLEPFGRSIITYLRTNGMEIKDAANQVTDGLTLRIVAPINASNMLNLTINSKDLNSIKIKSSAGHA